MDIIDKLKAKGYELLTDKQVFRDELQSVRSLQAFDENGSHFSLRLEGEKLVVDKGRAFCMDKTVYLKKTRPSIVHQRITPPLLRVTCKEGEVGTVHAAIGMHTDYGTLVRYAQQTVWVLSPTGYLRRYRGGIDKMPSVHKYHVNPDLVEWDSEKDLCA